MPEVLEALEVPAVPEVTRFVLLCMLQAVEGGLCLLEVPEVIRCVLLYMPEVMRCVFSVCWRPWEMGAVCWRC